VSAGRIPAMLLLRLTQKAMKRFDQKPRQVETSMDETLLSDWYVSIADEYDGEFALCVNARSLYGLVLPIEKIKTIDKLVEVFLGSLACHMVDLGIDRSSMERVMSDYSHVLVAKTASRSVLGSINDLTDHLYFRTGQQMQETGELDLHAIEAELNIIPQRPIGWGNARDRLVEMCKQRRS
jgi:hypothetical protein